MPGPPPKRSEERIRRNATDVPIERIQAIGPVDIPDLDMPTAHPMIKDLYQSLKDSAQSKYFEASDWQYARFALHFANKLLRSSKPSSQMLVAVNAMFIDLLMPEGARRKVRLEIERNPTAGEVVNVAEMFKQRASGK